MTQKLIPSMTGFKATDKDMRCRGYQFKLGEWHELPKDKPLELCSYGFHFCKYPSGVWAYRSGDGTRVFKVEAEEVLDAPVEPGADYKLVAYRIRLVEEVSPCSSRPCSCCHFFLCVPVLLSQGFVLDALEEDAEISFSRFKKLPGITKKKLDSLHKAHIDRRKK